MVLNTVWRKCLSSIQVLLGIRRNSSRNKGNDLTFLGFIDWIERTFTINFISFSLYPQLYKSSRIIRNILRLNRCWLDTSTPIRHCNSLSTHPEDWIRLSPWLNLTYAVKSSRVTNDITHGLSMPIGIYLNLDYFNLTVLVNGNWIRS